MQFLYPRRPFVNASIYRSSDSQSTSNDGAHARQEACKRLRSFFPIDDFHGRNILRPASVYPILNILRDDKYSHS